MKRTSPSKGVLPTTRSRNGGQQQASWLLHQQKRQNGGGISIAGFILTCILVSFGSLYVGFALGLSSAPQVQCPAPPPPQQQEEHKHDNHVSAQKMPKVIPQSMEKLFAGMARVDRKAFAHKFDVGVPLDAFQKGNEEVLMLYSDEKAIPPARGGGGPMPKLDPVMATSHCNQLRVVLTQPFHSQECLAIMGQWESNHVQKFMRLPEKGGPINEKEPLRFVSRTHLTNGDFSEIPSHNTMKKYDKTLVAYLSSLDSVLKELEPLAKKTAKDNTIVVMVCNHGQSELLQNFVCSSKSRGLDLSQVLVFCTDLQTKEIAEGLGMTAFYDQVNYKQLPEEAAQKYGDGVFAGMMLAKLYCVHMINKLGYDLLFQDVDMLWYKNPVDYFTEKKSDGVDIYFQDDGGRPKRFAPYSPNTGFYFVRYNERTEYFFHSLLMMGNFILTSRSHQEAMNILLSEHASWHALRVKVFSVHDDTQDFPGGFHYHMRPKFMKDFIQGKVSPYIFHMSWTTNKDNKLLFLRQMGEWFVKDECKADGGTDCCLAEPHFSCHYSDKPSKLPCKDSPPIDKGRGSFW